MKKTITLITFCLATCTAFAQLQKITYGKVDIADLELKQCDFEKDANAMVLYDKGEVYYDDRFNIIMERIKRIKIFNDKGKDEANIRIPYYAFFSNNGVRESITGIQAETINEVNGKAEITKLDSKLIYNQVVDKVEKAIVFTFPNVKPGSVLEFKYRWQTSVYSDVPDWYFQTQMPVRYSEYDTEIPNWFYFKNQSKGYIPYVYNKTESGDAKSIGQYTILTTRQTRAMASVPSLVDEPYMRSRADNLACVLLELVSVQAEGDFVHTVPNSWPKVGGALADDEDFGDQLKKKLKGEEEIIAKAKTMHTDDEKIAYIFNTVKNRMKWNEVDRWYTNDGTPKAWEKQTGNATEINIIVYHLLKAAGVKAYPMVVSTRNHGVVNGAYPYLSQFNRAVTYVPVDSARRYILDASNKYNTYNEIPDELLNSSGLYISKDDKVFDILYLNKDQPARQIVMVTAEIKPDGKMEGNAEISSSSYFKQKRTEQYKKDGEEKYRAFLKDNDNNLSIADLKLEDLDVDTLPLSQKLNFKLALTGSDDNYIYFNPNLFSGLKTNPFLSETRATNIDFGYLTNYSINGSYKIPAGYKIDALPKNMTLVMPDQSISFRRIVMEQDGAIIVRYVINSKKAIFLKEQYPEFYNFYKKMNEMLNEQIVLKKG
ncbi:DUF3857 domain-containing protein [Mucilaginibacter sp. PPCGB 2223]|uniref:DUF3857 domain-containing protein n=1 Tax=Mucilaginibacter sp. PPCGB 2223 TaxID=1886027 RepID=UPI00158652F7|nr:DUF3857 domain-containing protein [Mucilaginibacter sp. PPCGB 2223]